MSYRDSEQMITINNSNDLREQYRRLYGLEPVEEAAIPAIESVLNLKLPEDFKAISLWYRGGFLGGKSHHAISAKGPATNIVEETLRLRQTVALPHHFVVLAEPAAGLIVMSCDPTAPQILWCNDTDATRLGSLEQIRNPQIWPNYTAFFDYLLNEEEEERNEV